MEILLRPSVPEDVPVQRTLWSLSFGDERAYINNFYKNYYRPDRVLVLEVEGAVGGLTWMDREGFARAALPSAFRRCTEALRERWEGQ